MPILRDSVLSWSKGLKLLLGIRSSRCQDSIETKAEGASSLPTTSNHQVGAVDLLQDEVWSFFSSSSLNYDDLYFFP